MQTAFVSRIFIVLGMTTALACPSLHAQTPLPALDSATQSSSWRALRVAKWTTAAAAAGAAVYGVMQNRRADERFEQLEQVCVTATWRCLERLPNGAYADAELEAQYQEVRSLDSRARTALIAGQVGVAASVVLFILDLRNSGGPENIPYEPRKLDVRRARDGGMSLTVRLDAGR